MQTKFTIKPKRKRITNISDEVRTMKGELQDTEPESVNELSALTAAVAELRADVEQIKQQLVQQPAPTSGYHMSSRQALRWQCIRFAKDQLIQGTTPEITADLIGKCAEFLPLFDKLSETQAQRCGHSRNRTHSGRQTQRLKTDF
jgi:hypothetical protein